MKEDYERHLWFILAVCGAFCALAACPTPPAQKTVADKETAAGVYPIQEGFVDANGVLIYYKAIGRGAPLVICTAGRGARTTIFFPTFCRWRAGTA